MTMVKDIEATNDATGIASSESGESAMSGSEGHNRRRRRPRIRKDTTDDNDVGLAVVPDNDKHTRNNIGRPRSNRNNQRSWEFVSALFFSATSICLRIWNGDASRMRRHQNDLLNNNDGLHDDNKKRKSLLFLTRKTLIRLFLIIIILLLAIPFKLLFGQKGSVHGGLLGRLIDSTIRTYTFRKTLKARDDQLAQMGYHLPKLTQENVNKRGLPVLTQSYLAETLLGSSERKRRRAKAEKNVDTTAKCKVVPTLILQPNSGSWYRPFRVSGEFELLEFQESEMRMFMKEHFPTLPDNDVHIWGLCALYWYGGYFVSSKVRTSNAMTELFPTKPTPCGDSASLIFHDGVVELMKATPRHPSLFCAIQKLVDASQTGLTPPSVDVSLFGANITKSGQWFEDSCSDGQRCCQLKATSPQTGTLYLQSSEHERDNNLHQNANSFSTQRVYSVVERVGNAAEMKKPKRSISAKLAAESCEAGWLCNRCLKTSWFGSFAACRYVCRSCYINAICKGPDEPERNVIHIDLVASESQGYSPISTTNNAGSRIPRVIHQTWFEDVTVEKYPHLVRLQNSWKASGWEYRFYNDEAARKYIRTHFPLRFLDAFDSIIPGAFKADLFRLLVLLREGGIYVDADVKLDIDLDLFVTQNMGFFAPRDFIGGYAFGCYCFWNGLIGAEPGHPFIVKAVERMLNVVLNRGDYYDIERETCRASHEIGDTEVWKLRALDILTLTGPCAFGLSVNAALGRKNFVHTFDTGWFHDVVKDKNFENVSGDILFLTPDKYDMGEFRFTDVGRNLLVASTEHTMFIKKPLLKPEEAQASLKAHYSSKEHISEIFGEYGVYIDNLVTNEIYDIRLQ